MPGEETTILYRFRSDFPAGEVGFAVDIEFADEVSIILALVY